MKRLLIAAFATTALMAMNQSAMACGSASACPVIPDEGVAGEVTLERGEATKLSKDGTVTLDEGKLIDLGEAGAPGPESGPRKQPESKWTGDQDAVQSE